MGTVLGGAASIFGLPEHLLTAEAGVVFAAQCVEAHLQFGDRESGEGLWIQGRETHEFLQIDDFADPKALLAAFLTAFLAAFLASFLTALLAAFLAELLSKCHGNVFNIG